MQRISRKMERRAAQNRRKDAVHAECIHALSRDADGKRRPLPNLAIDFQLAAMSLRNDIVAEG